MNVTATFEHHQIVLRSRDHGEVFAVTIAPPDALSPRVKTLKVSEPPARKAGIKVPDVATLVAKLRGEAKVL